MMVSVWCCGSGLSKRPVSFTNRSQTSCRANQNRKGSGPYKLLIAPALYISEKSLLSSYKPPSLSVLLVKEVSKLNRQLYIYILYIICIYKLYIIYMNYILLLMWYITELIIV